MISTVLYCWCGIGAGGCHVAYTAQGLVRRLRGGCGRAALVLSLVSGCSLMLLVVLGLGLSGAVCCFVSTAPVCVGVRWVLPWCFPAALGLANVLRSLL